VEAAAPTGSETVGEASSPSLAHTRLALGAPQPARHEQPAGGLMARPVRATGSCRVDARSGAGTTPSVAAPPQGLGGLHRQSARREDKGLGAAPGMPGGAPMVIGRLRPQDERDVVTERRKLAEEVSGVAGPAPFASRRFARSGKSLRSARHTAAAFADQSAHTKASSGSRSPSGLAAASARGTPPHGPSSGRRPLSCLPFYRFVAF